MARVTKTKKPITSAYRRGRIIVLKRENVVLITDSRGKRQKSLPLFMAGFFYRIRPFHVFMQLA